MPSALKKITIRAKQIFKKGGTWKTAIKKASAEYRAGHKPKTVKKKAARKKTARRVSGIRKNADRIDRKKVNVTIGSVSHHKSQARKAIKNRIEQKAGRRELVIKVRDRKKLTKEIAKLKKEYRAMC